MAVRIYQKEHIDYLRKIVPGRNVDEILILFNVKFPSIKLNKNKLEHIRNNYKIRSGTAGGVKKYTDEQLKYLKKIIPGHHEAEISELFKLKFGLNLNSGQIGNLKRKLNVKSGTIGGQFLKGQISHNKGKKWSEFMSEEGQKNSLKTCFKKGNIPVNRREIGEERVDADGYLFVKIQDGHKNHNWILKHRYIWEQVNGPIPEKSKIVFLDGNKLNCDISNLAIVNYSEQLIINKHLKECKNPEIYKSLILLSKVIDKTNKLKRGK